MRLTKVLLVLAALLPAAVPALAVDISATSPSYPAPILKCTIADASFPSEKWASLAYACSGSTWAANTSTDVVACTAFTTAWSVPTFSHSKTFKVGSADYPTPPADATWSVSITFDAITAVPAFVSSSSAAITYPWGQFRASPTLTVTPPSSFDVTGSYTVTGPSTTVGPTSFSVTFDRDGSGDVAASVRVALDPPTTQVTWRREGRLAYDPDTAELYDASVDGRLVTIEWLTCRPMPIAGRD